MNPSGKPLILHYFQDFHAWGGIMTFLHEILPRIQAHGAYEVAFLGTEDSLLSQGLKARGIKVYSIPYSKKDERLRRLWPLESLFAETHLMRHWRQVHSLLDTLRPACIHTHMGEGEHFHLLRAGFPVIRTFHGSVYGIKHHGNNLLKLKYHQWCLSRFSRLAKRLSGMTVVSGYEYRELKRVRCLPVDAAVPVRVIHNGIDIDAFYQRLRDSRQTIRTSLGLPQDVRIIGLFSRLDPDKNSDAFLAVARNLRRQLLKTSPQLAEKTHFLVGGSGIFSGGFQKSFAEDELLTGYAHYLGYREDVPSLLNAVDFTVSMSLDEGFGLSVLESLIFGRPCIAFNTGGIPEILTIPQFPEAAKCLIPVGEYDTMVTVLSDLLRLPHTDLARWEEALKARARQFDVSRQVAEMETFYQDVFHFLQQKPKQEAATRERHSSRATGVSLINQGFALEKH